MLILDIETSGFSPTRDAIIEVGVARIRRGKIAETFSSLVNPHRHLHPRIVEITRLHDKMLKDAPDFKDIRDELYAFCSKGGVIVGYNVNFDKRFLVANDPRFNTLLYHDYLPDMRKAYPYLENHKMSTVASYLGVRSGAAHSALGDVEILFGLMKYSGIRP